MSLSIDETRFAPAGLTDQEAETRMARLGSNERVATLRHSALSTLARVFTNTLLIGLVIAACALPGSSQTTPDLQTFFRQDIGLSPDQIAAIQKGEPVAKNLPSRVPAEVFLFGAIYIHAAPEKYLQFARDFDRMRKLPNYLALGVFSDPPKPSDLKGFSFDKDDIQA